MLSHSGSLAASTVSLLGVLAIAVAVAVTRVRDAVDRRVAVLVATGLLLYLASPHAARRVAGLRAHIDDRQHGWPTRTRAARQRGPVM